ncbi:MAG: regulatory iron-sulfur-containing complex subunit RicT [Victivallaceae bacterium]|nr:regulatory iron-sulfur-containing complex subunit RicT [Victivallaceae bacterium]
MDIIYAIQIDNGAQYLAKADDSLAFKAGDWCVIHKDFFNDYGQIVKISEEGMPDWKNKELPQIIRKATVHDKSMAHENEMRAKSALRTTQEAADQLKLEMKLLNVHFSLDKKLIVIQFTADGRIDFRQLVKDLAKTFNARIELRQIGVRDETALKGGLGICGRQLCCSRFLKDFSSINVRMAKDQDLSLTPSTISGFCGRLKCCLKYEHDGYVELEKTMPRRGDMCDCPGGRGKICDRNLLTQEVVVVLEDSGRTIRCARSEVQVVYPDKYKVRPQEIVPDLSEDELNTLESEEETENIPEKPKGVIGRRRKKRRAKGKRSKR